MEPVINLTSPIGEILILRATRQVGWRAPVAILAMHAQPMATVLVVLDSCIEAGVQTSPGNRRTAVHNAETVRHQPSLENSPQKT